MKIRNAFVCYDIYWILLQTDDFRWWLRVITRYWIMWEYHESFSAQRQKTLLKMKRNKYPICVLIRLNKRYFWKNDLVARINLYKSKKVKKLNYWLLKLMKDNYHFLLHMILIHHLMLSNLEISSDNDVAISIDSIVSVRKKFSRNILSLMYFFCKIRLDLFKRKSWFYLLCFY